MKILQIIPYFVPAWNYGGPLRQCYELSKELVRRGHEVTVFTTDTVDASKRTIISEEEIDGIKVKRFKNVNNSIAYHHNISLSPGMLPALGRQLKDFDLVHIHEYRTIQNVFVLHYAVKYDTPYVLQAHGSATKLATFFQKKTLKKIFDNLWGYRILKGASRLIALTKAETLEYISMGITKDKIELVPNAIDIAEFECLPKAGEFRKKYGLNNSLKVILYLGRIHRIKGLDLLMKSVAKLPKDACDVKIVIAGPDDGYLSMLEKIIRELKIEEKVLITGPLYDKEKLEAYVDADVYILPSYYESFSITVLEALACGTPVIITEGCGIAERVKGEAGLVVNQDEKGLRDAMLYLLSNDKLRKRLGERGRLMVFEQYSMAQIAKQMENIYQNLLKKDLLGLK